MNSILCIFLKNFHKKTYYSDKRLWPIKPNNEKASQKREGEIMKTITLALGNRTGSGLSISWGSIGMGDRLPFTDKKCGFYIDIAVRLFLHCTWTNTRNIPVIARGNIPRGEAAERFLCSKRKSSLLEPPISLSDSKQTNKQTSKLEICYVQISQSNQITKNYPLIS